MKNLDKYELLNIESLKSPGTCDNPCAWWDDWFTDKKDLDSEELKCYEKEEMWICILIRASLAMAWFRKNGNSLQNGLWFMVYEKAYKRWLEEKTNTPMV